MMRPGFLSGINIPLSKAAELAKSSAFYELSKGEQEFTGKDWWKQRAKWSETWGRDTASMTQEEMMAKQAVKKAEKKIAPKAKQAPAVQEVGKAAEKTLAKGLELTKIKEARVQKATEAQQAKAAGAPAVAQLAKEQEKKLAKVERKAEKEFQKAQVDLKKKVDEGQKEAIASQKKETAQIKKSVIETEVKKKLATSPVAMAEVEREEIKAVKEKQVVQIKRMKEDSKEQQRRARVRSLWVTQPLYRPRDVAKRKKIVDHWMETDARKRTKRAEEDAKLDEKHTKKVEKVARKWITGNIWGRSPWGKLY